MFSMKNQFLSIALNHYRLLLSTDYFYMNATVGSAELTLVTFLSPNKESLVRNKMLLKE